MRDYNPYNGMTETYSKDQSTGAISVTSTQDSDPFFAYNKAQLDNATRGFKGDMHKMASIHEGVLLMWRDELKAKGADSTNPLSQQNRKFLLAKLNSPDWNKLRTKQGII